MVVGQCLNLYKKLTVGLKSLVWVGRGRVVKKNLIKRNPVCQTAIFVVSICRKSRKANTESALLLTQWSQTNESDEFSNLLLLNTRLWPVTCLTEVETGRGQCAPSAVCPFRGRH